MMSVFDALLGVNWGPLLWPQQIDRWAHPLALLGLLVLPVLAARWLTRRRAAASYPGVHRAARAPRSLRSMTGWAPPVLRSLAITLLVVAAARPQSTEGQTRERTEGIAMQLVIDRSSSMRQQIVMDGRAATRFEAVKEVVKDFVAGDGEQLRGREGDLIGLIAFARYADTIAPLVRDHEAIPELLEPLEMAGVVNSEDGTNIGDALALAVSRLRRAEREVLAASNGEADPDFEIKSKVVVLLTDGEHNREDAALTPLQAAQLAADLGIRVYTIGVGSSRIVTQFGMTMRQPSGVDEALLKTIAEATGGQFFMAADADALRRIYATIDELETTEIETSELTRYEEEFTPFAAWALGLLALEAVLRGLVYRRLP